MSGFIDPILINRLNATINSVSSFRKDWINSRFDGRRDIAKECGFPEQGQVDAHKMSLIYKRDSLAARVVDIWPRECWQVPCNVFASEGSNSVDPFDIALKNLSRSLVSEPGYNVQELGNPIYEYLCRADIMSGIGRYGIVVFGLDDGLPLDQPARFSPDALTGYGLKSLRVFDEANAPIVTRDANLASPRLGQPVSYNVTFNNDDELGIAGSIGSATQNVHWTRVLHICDVGNSTTSEIVAPYRIEPVLNNILTAQKSIYGSGEMYWQGALPGLSVQSHPQLGGDVQINRNTTKDQIEQYLNGMQRYLLSTGLDVKSLSTQAVDPSPWIDAQITMICIKLGVPVRIFKGSERGELASTQDDDAWNDRVKQRQNGYLTPRVVAPFFNRLVNLGILPKPTSGYKIEWPDITSQSNQIKSQVALSNTQALAAYYASPMKDAIPLEVYLSRFLDKTDDEVKAIMDAIAKATKVAVGMEALVTTPTDTITPSNPSADPNTTVAATSAPIVTTPSSSLQDVNNA